MKLYKKLPGFSRNLIERIIKKIEHGEYFSKTIRKIYLKNYNIKVGIGSYGCFNINQFPEGTTVGNYCSIAPRVYFLYSNHPMERTSTHPLFYNKDLGFVKENKIERVKLTIGDDVWIGANTTITRGCTKIGTGSVIGAGSVVTHDVPEFAIVAGNPARIIRYRFDDKIIATIKESKWYDYSPEVLSKYIKYSDYPIKFCEQLKKGEKNERNF